MAQLHFGEDTKMKFIAKITKIRKLLSLVATSILMLLPQVVLAVTPNSDPFDATNPVTQWGSLFRPFDNDLSIHFLRQIFGNIPGSGLMSGSTSILSQIFYVFNCGVFGLAALFLTYVVVLTIYDVAHNPEQMKGKANWMQIIRIPLSVGLMVPIGTSGYSSLNAVIMWAVVQSVGLADNVWQTVVDYMSRGGILYNTTVGNQKSADQIDATLLGDNKGNAGTSDVMRSQICMHSLQRILEDTRVVLQSKAYAAKALTQGTGDAPATTYVSAGSSTKVELKAQFINGDLDANGKPQYIAMFPYVTDQDLINWGINSEHSKKNIDPSELNGKCGAYVWDNVPGLPGSCTFNDSQPTPPKKDTSYIDNYNNQVVVEDKDNGITATLCDSNGPEYYKKTKGLGFSDLMTGLDNPAKEIVDGKYGQCSLILPHPNTTNTANNTGDDKYPVCSSIGNFNNFAANSGPQTLAMATSSYQSSIYSARLLAGGTGTAYYLNKSSNQDVNKSRAALRHTVNNGGWVLAGKYYFDLLQTSNDTLSPLDDTGKTFQFAPGPTKGSVLAAPAIQTDGPNTAFKDLASEDTDSLYKKLKGIWGDVSQFDDGDQALENVKYDAQYFSKDFALNLALVNTINDGNPQVDPFSGAVGLINKINTNMTSTSNTINKPIIADDYINNVTASGTEGMANLSVQLWSPMSGMGVITEPLQESINTVICNWKNSLMVADFFDQGDEQQETLLTLSQISHQQHPGVYLCPGNLDLNPTDAPIVKVAKLGQVMIAQAVIFWKVFFDKITMLIYTMFGVSTVLTAVSGAVAAGSFLGITQGVSAFINTCATLLNLIIKVFVEIPISVGLPLAMAVTGLLFTTGATMAFYVPMIPFMLFTFGVISWLSLVIEAMAAAPIVALGMAHPGGQEFLGSKGEQALMLVFAIFLRPVSMIIGLVAALVLSYVSIDVLNLGFGHLVLSEQALTATNSFAHGSIDAPTAFDQMKNGAMILVYVFMVMALVNQCFSLIHVLPTQLTRWIGVGQPADQSERHLQEVQKGLGDFAGAFSKGATEGGAAISRSLGHSGKEIDGKVAAANEDKEKEGTDAGA